jgi:hypothetical protein
MAAMDDDMDEQPELDTLPAAEAPPPPVVPLAPQTAYREALRGYDGALLATLASAVGQLEPLSGRASLANGIADRLGEPRVAERLLAGLPLESKLAMSLYAVTETSTWPCDAMSHALGCLGIEAREAVRPLVELGLVVVSTFEGTAVRHIERALDPENAPGSSLVAHPAAVAGARTVLPGGRELPRADSVRQVRESDALEPILRLAVVWQRVLEAPLRQTQQGTLYKRDRDRLEDDPLLAGPIADAIEPLPDMPAFWMTLARGVGLLESEPGSERVTAARPDYWAENAFHLPQMIAIRWLALRSWHEQGGLQRDGALYELALPYIRPALLLWLATLGDDEWVTIDDLAHFLRALAPRWDKAALAARPVAEPPPPPPPVRGRGAKAKPKNDAPVGTPEPGALEAILLGAAYQLGLVRTAEEVTTARRAVQLTPLGRYILALGPPPPPRATYEHFLFVQPSFEIIAYRQGLNPSLIGQLSRFAIWSQVGAAMAMRLTPESVYHGLEGGMTPRAMLDLLSRHASRPLPAGVAEAVRTWSGRRDRVTYHASATLVEFATPQDVELALSHWPSGPGPAPVRVSDRLLLVEDETAVPFHRFRMTGARDYRRPPEACVEVDPDGVTLTLDLARSDLLVDAELARFADEQTDPTDRPATVTPRRRFIVSAASLARAAEAGQTPAQLGQWFSRRTGGAIPPAIRLLLTARSAPVPSLSTSRLLVLQSPTADILDGLAQHPATRDYLGERLGPTTVVIPDDALASFRRVLERLGLSLTLDEDAPMRPGPSTTPTIKPR